MKNFYLKPLLLFFLFCIAISTKAYDCYVDGIYYNLSGDEAIVTIERWGEENPYYYKVSITIPETIIYGSKTYRVTSIGYGAFYGCSRLTSVNIPSSVTTIVRDAFYGCSGLTSINIPNSVTSIGEFAFYGCNGLTSVTIPSSVTRIGNYAFDGCSGLTSVTILSSVTSIGNHAFRGCSSLTSVAILGSVSVIDYSAFSGCINLAAVHITDLAAWCAISFIGSDSNPLYYAQHLYLNNKEITDLVIPEGVTSIGSKAFYGCSSLTSVTIPSSVTSIHDNAFMDCSGLTAVHISDLAAWCAISFADSDSNPLYYAQHLYLNNKEIADLVIPEGVTSIGYYAFYGCSNLTSVTIPSSVTSIAFYGCNNLTAVYITDLSAWFAIRFNSSGANPLYYAHHLYLNNKEVTNLVVPEGVATISNYAFYGCSNLTSVTIPSSVTNIGNSAFRDCSNLTSVTIPSSVTNIGSNAFGGCNNLTAVYITDLSAWCAINFGSSDANPLFHAHHLYLNNKEVTDLVVPEGVITISHSAFYGCSNLTSVTIPCSVTSIGNSAFSSCSGVKSIVVEEGNEKYDSRNNCNAIIETQTNTLISGCQNTVIPESVVSIGDYAFYDSGGLPSVTIPNNVTSIGNYAFGGTSVPKVIFCDNETPPIAQESSFPRTLAIVPEEYKEVYQAATGWKNLYINSAFRFIGCTQTTITLVTTSLLCEQRAWIVSNEGKIYTAVNDTLKLMGLKPNTGYTIQATGKYGELELSNTIIAKTKTVSAFIKKVKITNTTIHLKGYYDAGDATVTTTSFSPGFSGYGSDYYANGDEIILNNLEPGRTYIFNYMVNTDDGSRFVASVSCTTKAVDVKIEKVKITNTTIHLKGCYDAGDATVVYSGFDGNVGDEIVATGLEPGQKYSFTYTVRTSDGSVFSTTSTYTTVAVTANVLVKQITASSATLSGSLANVIDVTVENVGFEDNGYTSPDLLLTGLTPNTKYSKRFVVQLKDCNSVSKDVEFTTQTLSLTTQQPKVISAGNVIVAALANVDEAETNVGFEWRRTDWTNEFASNTGSAYVYDGMMEGYIRNLYTEKLWKFRPYYESASGNRYYGEWVGLDPTNTSYFEPTVHTYAQVNVNGNAAEVKGIAQRGTDNIAAQGFVYWTDSQEAKVRNAVGVQEDDIPEKAMTVTAKGQVMTTTLKGLHYDTDYCYTAFVTTSEGETFYGEKQTFRTGINPAYDLNGDGKCTVADVAMLLKVYLGQASSGRGDIDSDGSVTVSDITQLIEMYRQTKK